MKSALRLIWHTLRYGIATAISTALSAIIPVFIGSIPILLSILWILAWIALAALYFLTGDMGWEGEIGSPIAAALMPILFSALGIASITAALLAALAFGLLGILPASLLTEFICWRLSVRNIFARLAAFLIGGGILGVGLSGLFLLVNQVEKLVLKPTSLAIVIAIALMASVASVFTSGLILTGLTSLKNIAAKLINQAQAHNQQPV